jgi:hypothetical protein
MYGALEHTLLCHVLKILELKIDIYLAYESAVAKNLKN